MRRRKHCSAQNGAGLPCSRPVAADGLCLSHANGAAHTRAEPITIDPRVRLLEIDLIALERDQNLVGA